MGHPISDYSILKILMNDYNKRDIRYYDNILKKFKIYGVIIHDPRRHYEFDAILQRSFDRLDYLTGDKFLFFALTTPSKSMLEILERRGYYRYLQELIGHYFIEEQPELDKSITAYTISQALDIDFDELPVIVLTRDFNLNQYFVFKTNTKILEEQLTEIGYLATRMDELSYDINYLQNKNKELFTDYFQTSSYDSLAKVLTDFMAFAIYEELSYTYTEKDLAMSQVKDVLSRFSNFKKDGKEDEEILKRYLFLFGCLSNIEMENRSHEFNLNENCEEESKIIYRTFFQVYNNIFNIRNKISELLSNDPGIYNFDHSILVVPLCKIFEIEINLSVVHWVRSLLNIEMPTYFKRVKPEPGNYTITPLEELVPNPRPVDFNRGRNHRWIAPGIGESEFVCRTLYREGSFPEEINEYEELLNKWSRIRHYRNEAAHREILNEDDFNDVYNIFEYVRNNFLSQMNDLKLRMKFGSAG